MDNPLLVEVVRGGRVESCHRGVVAVVDSKGRRMFALGDAARPVYPRSAAKPLQALVLIESGAADHFGLGQEELAIACASHGGEEGHVATVTRMLALAGLDPSALKCGAHWPLHPASAQALARFGRVATPLHNNCSGKHAGFLCAAYALGADRGTYVEPSHPVQRAVKAALEELARISIPAHACAVDGCSVPTWSMPLEAVAGAFARFGSGKGLNARRAAAARRLWEACTQNPWHVAGTGRFCTEIMSRFGARLLVKSGAEGICCAALPEQGLGIAVKCDDGAGRAAEIMMAATLARFLPTDTDRAGLAEFIRRPLRNWNGIAVGEIRSTEILAQPD
jgi:L-asparaginase II